GPMFSPSVNDCLERTTYAKQSECRFAITGSGRSSQANAVMRLRPRDKLRCPRNRLHLVFDLLEDLMFAMEPLSNVICRKAPLAENFRDHRSVRSSFIAVVDRFGEHKTDFAEHEFLGALV